jgi:hypothetical protein
MRNKPILLFLLLFLASGSYTSAQKCPSGKKDKKSGTENFSYIFTSKDYYSLLVQKETSYQDTSAAPKYWLLFTAASRVQFSDSMLATKGVIELRLTNGNVVTIDSVNYMNAPVGNGSLGFSAHPSEETISMLTSSPIEMLTVKNVLSTSFATKKQHEHPAIFTCLLQAKPKQ